MGEKEATFYLERNNYYVLITNFNTYYGEIDIIAKDLRNNEYVFLEVKTRTTKDFGRPSDAVNFYKIGRIINSSKYYIFINNLWNKKIRYDVIEVYVRGKGIVINHIKNIIIQRIYLVRYKMNKGINQIKVRKM